MKAGCAIIGFLLLTLSAEAQTPTPASTQWTIDDYNAGLIAIDPARGWSPQDWVAYYNRYHPKTVTVPLPAPPPPPPTPANTDRPDGCQAFDGYAVSDEVLARCLPHPTLVSPWTHQPYTIAVGEVYRDAYTDRILVLNVASDLGTTRRIVTVRVIRASDASHLGELRAVYEDVFPWFPLMPGETK
jgi:hypothetical protein